MAKTKDKPKTGILIPASKRKSLYKAQHKDELVSMMREGKSATQVAAAWGISRTTLYRWFQEKPDLKEAYDEAKTAAEAFWEDVGTAAVFGKIKGFNTKMFEINMRNRFGWDKDGKGAANQTINIENMTYNNMSEDELDKQIQAKLKELKLTGVEDVESDEDTEA